VDPGECRRHRERDLQLAAGGEDPPYDHHRDPGRVRRLPVELRRATKTPARHRTPPASASAGGVSPRRSQPSRIAIGVTRYVVEPMRPAVVRASAYPHVRKPSAIGAIARYTIQPIVDACVSGSWRASVPANGRQTIAPNVHASHVIWSGDTRASSGFCATTPAA